MALSVNQDGSDELMRQNLEAYPKVLEFLKQKEAKERVKEVKPKKSVEKDQELDL